MTARKLRLVVLCPHFAPDIAPTGAVMTRIVRELAALGHELHVVTSLPWYREHAIESGWGGRLWRTEPTAWGSITRVHPFPGKSRRNLLRRAIGFGLFSLIVGLRGLRVGRGRIDGVLAMSPPLTLGLTGRFISAIRRTSLIFNIQDVFPDAAIQTNAISNPTIIALARWLERVSYQASSAVVLLSDDLLHNVEQKVSPSHRSALHVIPNFVDTIAITPLDRMTDYRRELGIGTGMIVMYAGNVGFSQSIELLILAAREIPNIDIVINGDGAARSSLQELAQDCTNVHFVDYQPTERLGEVLASADIHVVPLKAGLASVSVPSKVYSILAAGRPILAAIDADSEIPRILASSGAGISVPPEDAEKFISAVRWLVGQPDLLLEMGAKGRRWVEQHVSATAVASEYEALFVNELKQR
ncbi:MAG: glycosyltransferase family 4 protein [Ilumatobacteraceae bacterium]